MACEEDRFVGYIGIDYSGAQTPTPSLKGLRIYAADRDSAPVEVHPLPGPKKYWSRCGVALGVATRGQKASSEPGGEMSGWISELIEAAKEKRAAESEGRG